MNSDRFTEGLVKKALILGTALCNLFTDILAISYAADKKSLL